MKNHEQLNSGHSRCVTGAWDLCWLASVWAVLALAAAGCSSNSDRLDAPQVLVSPYDTSQGDALWAVVPLANESGVAGIDTYMIADKLVAQIDQVRGVSCLPLNRTIAAMRARGMNAVRTPEDARVLSQTLGADALVIGTITAYDPYDPPKLGLAVALFAQPRERAGEVDPMRLGQAYSDDRVRVQSAYETRPVATVSEQYDGRAHDTLMDVKNYARGRHDTSSATGWRGVLASMDRFTEFAAYSSISRLIDQERLRVAMARVPVAPTETATQPTPE